MNTLSPTSCGLLLLAILSSASAQAQDIFAANKALGRGVNLGNALEAPKEGDWGMKIEAEFFPLIKQAGFQHVRLPVKWTSHAAKEAPYAIDAKFFERVDSILEQAAANKLLVVLNHHHYSELDARPKEELPRAIAIWQQIAARYKDRGAWLYFELMNEPHEELNKDNAWTEMIPPLLGVVRETNPTRPVIIGPPFWNGMWALSKFKLPEDKNLIVTVHYYNPFEFTHQGAHWVKDSDRWLGKKWTGSEAEMKAITKEFDSTAAWAKENNRPIYLGEFGAFRKADAASRVLWTAAITREAEARNFSWAYWEFGAEFSIYDREKKAWRADLRDALLKP
ncbi:Endoglucanase H precursor [Anatilimnocola aggregata]|uniref:Endoglucanase H n=1 Tax=Anatilimnocola aggregata TaxID=2528021 RepID=A0A517YBU9_9BACT|nr:glycoside hydrolase family 5 protein [Anatilimnocola aggregata]QDU27649.1 Endoglucanase H precursor [Anatilimnocola aggregata]